MRIFGKVDGTISRKDRAGWITPPFDLLFAVHYDSADLLEAILAHLSADVGLAAGLPGGIYSDEVPEDVPMPYLVIADPQDAATRPATTKGDMFDEGTYEANVYVESTPLVDGKDEARRLAWLVQDSLHDAPLAFERGTLIRLRQSLSPRGVKEPEPGPEGGPVYRQFLAIQYLVTRSL
jgi:hypothetical protein